MSRSPILNWSYGKGRAVILLLDTHALIYAVDSRQGRLGAAALDAMSTADAVWVSAISLFEIGQKIRIGKLSIDETKFRQLPDFIMQLGGQTIPVSSTAMVEASLLEWPHRDPFDRIIVATAREHDCMIVSKDAAIKAFEPDRTIW